MAAVPSWRDTSDVLITTGQDIEGLSGVAGTALAVRFYNNFGDTGADPITNGRIKAQFRETSSDPYVGSGIPWADQRYVEGRITGGLGGLTLAATGWKPLGAGSFLELPTISGDGQGVALEFRVHGPTDAPSDAVQYALQVAVGTSESLPDGITEGIGSGIYLGLGDAGQTVHVYGGATVENPGGADDEVQTQTHVVIAAGVARIIRQSLSGAIPAAGAGDARYDLFSISPAGVRTRTAGTESTPPLDDSDKPALPAGHVPLSYVFVDDSGVIANADIENVIALGLYAFSSSGLIATIAGGPLALVDNALCHNAASQNATLTASETNYIWLLRTGELEVTITSAPPTASPRALLLHEADTDGSVVTAHRDRRFFIGYRRHVIEFEWLGELVDEANRYGFLPSERDAQIVPLWAVQVALGAQGDGTAGRTRWTIEVERAGVFTDLFATDSTRPMIAFDAAPPVGDPLTIFPDRFDLPARCRIRARPTEIPSGGSGADPENGILTLEVAL